MPRKKRLVECDIFVGEKAFAGLYFYDSVDEKERKSMGQIFLD